MPGFEGTEEELEVLLLEGLASKELSVDEFWKSVNKQTDALLGEHKAGRRSRRFRTGRPQRGGGMSLEVH